MPNPLARMSATVSPAARGASVTRRASPVAVALVLLAGGLVACDTGGGDDRARAHNTPTFTGTAAGSAAQADAPAADSASSTEPASSTESPTDPSASSDGSLPLPGSRDVSSGTTCVDGENITISVDNVAPIVEGECGTVTVTASSVEGHVESALTVRMTGQNNSLLGEDWGTLSLDGQNSTVNVDNIGTLTVNGDANIVLGNTFDHIRVHGDSNVLNWDDGAEGPDVDTGRLNSYTR